MSTMDPRHILDRTNELEARNQSFMTSQEKLGTRLVGKGQLDTLVYDPTAAERRQAIGAQAGISLLVAAAFRADGSRTDVAVVLSNFPPSNNQEVAGHHIQAVVDGQLAAGRTLESAVILAPDEVGQSKDFVRPDVKGYRAALGETDTMPMPIHVVAHVPEVQAVRRTSQTIGVLLVEFATAPSGVVVPRYFVEGQPLAVLQDA